VGLLTAQLINAAYNVMAQHILTKDGADPLVFSVYRDLAGARSSVYSGHTAVFVMNSGADEHRSRHNDQSGLAQRAGCRRTQLLTQLLSR